MLSRINKGIIVNKCRGIKNDWATEFYCDDKYAEECSFSKTAIKSIFCVYLRGYRCTNKKAQANCVVIDNTTEEGK